MGNLNAKYVKIRNIIPKSIIFIQDTQPEKHTSRVPGLKLSVLVQHFKVYEQRRQSTCISAQTYLKKFNMTQQSA